jgi:hypothetical protein
MDEVRAGREHGGDRQRRDDPLADADEDVDTDHRPGDRAGGCGSVAAGGVLEAEADRRHDDRAHGRHGGGADDGGPGPGEQATQRGEHDVAAERSDERHVEHVQAQRREPAVGEEQRLHGEDDA